MSEFQSEIGGVAASFAEISSKAAAAANLQQIQIAQGNIQAATGQIQFEETVQRREVSRALAQYQGQARADAAFRGGGQAGSATAILDAAAGQAADQAAVIEANAAFQEVAVKAANQVILQDPALAAIQGGVQGLQIGTQIAQSLLQEAQIETQQGSQAIGMGPGGIPVFQNFVTQFLDIPGLDLTELFGDFNF